MINIIAKNSYCYVNDSFNSLPRLIQNKITKELSYYKKVNFSTHEVSLFYENKRNQTPERFYQFPSGLLYKFVNLLKKYDIKFEISDQRGNGVDILPVEGYFKRLRKVDPNLEDRKYQSDAISKSLKVSRGIINHSTSAGKTLVLSGIIYCLNCRTLVVCIGKEHVTQITQDLEKFTGRNVSQICEGKYSDRGPIIVANAQALAALKRKDKIKYIQFMESCKCLIIDEVHHISGNPTFKEPFYYAINARYRFGFSGTVYREDGAIMEAEAATGPIISKVDYNYLTVNNYICKARFMFIDPMCEYIAREDEIWPNCMMPGIILNDRRNLLIKKICDKYSQNNKQVLVLSPVRVEHGKILNKMIENSNYVFGESDNYYRKQIIRDFASKKFNVIIASKIFDEVINLPDLRCIILAGGGKAHNATYQRIGRGIRRAEGKEYVDIICFWDSHSEILLRHSKKIKKYIENVDVWKENIRFIGNHRERYDNY